MKQIFVSICLFVSVCLAGCVQDDSGTLESRIAVLESTNALQASQLASLDNQMEEQQTQLRAVGEKAEKSLSMATERYAAINYEIEQIKEQFLQNQGRLEELNSLGMAGSKTEFSRLDDAISRNYERLVRLEKYMGFEPVAGPVDVSGKPSVPASEPAPVTEDSLYDAAKALFDKGDFENSRIGFENFINKYPKSKKADNARFWIADSYYSEKWYEKAILEYQKVLEVYPDSNKTVAARLKQGYAFAQLGETANARLILNDLIKRHPDTREAGFAREKLKTLD